ncbi:hypothetical protein BMS3Abin03_01816 [bacterium BMS3Abin03]|nr:hypothetical protein BMS3Abin03_01816 [bacterium BMS3Abin03]
MKKYSLFTSALLAQLLFYPVCYFAQAPVKSNMDNKMNSTENHLIIDSHLTYEDALKGISIPAAVKQSLEIITVQYFGYDGRLHQGQLIVNKKAAADLKEIFNFIKETKFPVEKVKPIVEYKWSDDKSMSDNNTSVFNYRFVSGTKVLSMHANGLAIDINPMQNPYVKNGNASPQGSNYELESKGTITPNCPLVQEFKKRGWKWGGDWKNLKDYQHFQKE